MTPLAGRRPLVVLAGLVALLAGAAPSHAALSLSTPGGNPAVNPGAPVSATWAGECPAGELCGFWNYTKTDPGVYVAVGMAQQPTERNGVLLLDSGSEVGDGSSRATASPHGYRVDDSATAGQWYMVASWNECRPMGPTDVNLRDCTIVGSNVLPFRVRAMIGLKGSGDRARLDHSMTNGRRALFMRTTFGCNAGAANYLGSLVVQKRVKVGTRMIWRNATTKPRVQARRNDLHSVCTVDHTWTVPASITRTTQLRYTWSIKSTGIQPAAKPWKRTSASFTVTRAA
jgi:hypothetical protein